MDHVRPTVRSWPVAVGVGVLLLWVLVAVTIPLWAWASPHETVGAAAAVAELVAPARHRCRSAATCSCARSTAPADSIPTAAAVIVLTVAHRLGARCGRRLPRRLRRERRHADQRRRAGVPADLPGDGRRRRARPGPAQHACIALVLVWWPIYARLLRGQVLSIKHREHVEAAVVGRRDRASASCASTSCRSPFTPVMINATMDFGQVLILTASLSFLGLGATPPSPEWGLMIDDGTRELLPVVDRARPRARHPHRRDGRQLPRRRPA